MEPLPGEAELDQLCDDLWYHGLWTAKKLRRGELWTALECLDTYLRYRLAATFSGYDETSIGRALWALLDLAGRLEAELRARLGLEPRDRSEVERIIERIQPR